MDKLLTLMSIEHAHGLRVRAGVPPLILFNEDQRPLEGPPITAEAADHLLRSITGTRQMRQLRDTGAVQFVYLFEGRSPFLVSARMENENVAFDVL